MGRLHWLWQLLGTFFCLRMRQFLDQNRAAAAAVLEEAVQDLLPDDWDPQKGSKTTCWEIFGFTLLYLVGFSGFSGDFECITFHHPGGQSRPEKTHDEEDVEFQSTWVLTSVGPATSTKWYLSLSLCMFQGWVPSGYPLCHHFFSIFSNCLSHFAVTFKIRVGQDKMNGERRIHSRPVTGAGRPPHLVLGRFDIHGWVSLLRAKRCSSTPFIQCHIHMHIHTWIIS